MVIAQNNYSSNIGWIEPMDESKNVWCVKRGKEESWILYYKVPPISGFWKWTKLQLYIANCRVKNEKIQEPKKVI